jgi:succinyl-diaminopimelate desuccinylase
MKDVDQGWLEAALVSLLRADTQVPLGETEIQPGDAGIVAAVDEIVRPLVEELGPQEIRRHDAGDTAFRFGPEGNAGLLIQTYIVSQHANLMDDPNAGSIVDGASYGIEGSAGIGQGATQNKGPMAAALAALTAVEHLDRPVWLAVNTEGRSSHGGSARIIDDLGVRAAQGLIAFGTDLKVSLGNRGRVDVHVHVQGASSHSSQPWLGRNPIEGAAAAVVALRSLPVPERHPDLGPVSATPYQFSCHPVAPHTIPEGAHVVVDRRLLPGEDPATAVEQLRAHLHGHGLENIEVEAGVMMYPAYVEPGEPIVTALLEGLAYAGRPSETVFSLNAFDAGYASSKGIPTPMFGPGKRRFAGQGLVGTDAVSLQDCSDGARVIAWTIDALCGSGAGPEP